jgi:hypothetical protein
VSRLLERRLTKLEAAKGPKVLGYWHAIYARDEADYEAQRASLISSGRAKPNAFCVEVWLAPDEPSREPETIPETRTHEEWVDILAQEERAR